MDTRKPLHDFAGTAIAQDCAYDHDFHAWAIEQALLLREGRVAEADLAHIAEEIESMGRSQKTELVNRLAVLLAHLLKWQAQPNRRGRSWQLTIREQRLRLGEHLQDNPSLKAGTADALASGYRRALLRAQRDTGLPEEAFPGSCPWTLDQVLDDGFLPG